MLMTRIEFMFFVVFVQLVMLKMGMITAIPIEDEITSLPDFGPPPFRTSRTDRRKHTTHTHVQT